MDSPTQRKIPELVWPLEPIPDGLDRELLLDEVHDAFAEMIRSDLLPASLPPIARVLIEVFAAVPPSRAWVVRISIQDAEGATLGSFSTPAWARRLPEKAFEVAVRFAGKENAQEAIRRRRIVEWYPHVRGEFIPPRVRDLDAPSAAALAAALDGSPTALRAHAGAFLAAGKRTGHVDHLLHAADLYEIAGDLASAHAALDLLVARGGDVQPVAFRRRDGLAAHEHLGSELVAMLLWSARVTGRVERRGLFPTPLPPDVVGGAVSAALALHGCDFIKWRFMQTVRYGPEPVFGRYLGAVFLAGWALDMVPDRVADRYARCATPWLRTLVAPGEEAPPGVVTPSATVLERAWSLVRWDLWRALIAPERDDLDALIAAHPDFEEAHACRALITIPRGAAEVVAVVDPWLASVKAPYLRASMLYARGAARTDAGQLVEGLADLDAAAALDPGSFTVSYEQITNRRLQASAAEEQEAASRPVEERPAPPAADVPPSAPTKSTSWVSRLDPWVILFGLMLVMLVFRFSCARSP